MLTSISLSPHSSQPRLKGRRPFFAPSVGKKKTITASSGAPKFDILKGSTSQGRSQGGGAGGPGPPPKSGGSQKYVRGDPCDLGSEAKNRGSAPPPRNGWGPPETKSWLRPCHLPLPETGPPETFCQRRPCPQPFHFLCVTKLLS